MQLLSQYLQAFPKTSPDVLQDISIFMESKKSNFKSTKDKKVFLAQIAHESMEFSTKIENLNYSREGLLKVFPKYFNTDNVSYYARCPERIANKVYSNRMGNGDEKSGDGWKYRGRGFIQLTGKTNILQFLEYINVLKCTNYDIDYLETTIGALESAKYFWDKHNCDNKDITESTKIINGGLNGLKERIDLYNKIDNILYK